MQIRLLLVGLLLTAGHLFAGEGDVIAIGQKAPAFAGTATDGTSLSLESLAGKVVLIDFFATWCGPCMEEMPLIEKEIWQTRPDGLVVIGVGRQHSVEELAKFKAAKQFTFPLVADPGRGIFGKYATQNIPRCYLVGRDGIIKYASTGYDPAEFARMKAAIAAELKK